MNSRPGDRQHSATRCFVLGRSPMALNYLFIDEIRVPKCPMASEALRREGVWSFEESFGYLTGLLRRSR